MKNIDYTGSEMRTGFLPLIGDIGLCPLHAILLVSAAGIVMLSYCTFMAGRNLFLPESA